ncbi:MAG: 30S ribosomal protein S19 [Candidatus Diapherotrites archaeon]|uniref:Small ribosomal subunit protein uS19 n=1 Tax=Candidatus Iainarchaeum sp. TaxID=3101447 RepID=A0A8T3YLD9_9ARCH|nr:30S ribosomal protein S19 [Candidatus Diapherotrites archaeon]
MARKEFTFKGKTVQELEAMSVEDFSKLCTSRARRTIKRTLVEMKKFLKKAKKAHETMKLGKFAKPVRTHNRDLIVVPGMIGVTVAIYNGKEFVNAEIKERMLGHYLGEFVLTRKKLTHGKAGIGATKSSTAINARG